MAVLGLPEREERLGPSVFLAFTWEGTAPPALAPAHDSNWVYPWHLCNELLFPLVLGTACHAPSPLSPWPHGSDSGKMDYGLSETEWGRKPVALPLGLVVVEEAA